MIARPPALRAHHPTTPLQRVDGTAAWITPRPRGYRHDVEITWLAWLRRPL
jgi:hypothetical protein